MLKLIVGTKGSGKTKTMIDMIDKAVKTTSGNIVVIEKVHEAHHRDQPLRPSGRR